MEGAVNIAFIRSLNAGLLFTSLVFFICSASEIGIEANALKRLHKAGNDTILYPKGKTLKIGEEMAYIPDNIYQHNKTYFMSKVPSLQRHNDGSKSETHHRHDGTTSAAGAAASNVTLSMPINKLSTPFRPPTHHGTI